jgi:hypothetical protein
MMSRSNWRSQGKTAMTHPHLVTIGTLVSQCGCFYEITGIDGNNYRVARLGHDANLSVQDVDFNVRRLPLLHPILICEPPSDEGVA